MGRFRRMAEAFDVTAQVRDCDSSGSEHSPETMMDLSDLVNSFIESGGGVVDGDFDMRLINDDEFSSDGIDDDMEETKESLKRLFRSQIDDVLRRNVLFEVDKAWQRVIGDDSSPPLSGLKRRLMSRLRDQGLDAGLCKSKWEKKGRLPSGDYEYVDVNVEGTRYVVIVSLVEEFEIARPTDNYASLLEILPQISVCKVEELREIVKTMCKAIKKSMKQMRMMMPPWRRREYVQAKWFGPYKRTTNDEFGTKMATDHLNENKKKSSIGFISIGACSSRWHTKGFGSRKDFGLKMGNLAMVMNRAS